MPQDPFTFRGITRRLPSMHDMAEKYTKEPYIGLTQGGSSRSNAAIVAARKSKAPGDGNAIASALATTPEEDPTDV